MKSIKELTQKLLSFFPNVEFFEEEHKYLIFGEQFPSVSTFVEDFYNTFDKEGISKSYAARRGFSQQDVLDAWDGNAKISTDNGTDVHNFAEDLGKFIYFGEGTRPKVTCIKGLGVVDFYNSLPEHIVPVSFELIMYLRKYRIVGTTDIVLYNRQIRQFIIADYKTSEDLFETGFDNDLPLKIIPPSEGIKQNSFGKFSIQLNLYQFMFEAMTGYKVYERWLIHLRKGRTLHEVYLVNDLQKYIEPYLKDRLENVE